MRNFILSFAFHDQLQLSKWSRLPTSTLYAPVLYQESFWNQICEEIRLYSSETMQHWNERNERKGSTFMVEPLYRIYWAGDRIEGTSWRCIILRLASSKNESIQKFRKIAYIKRFLSFFVILCITMHFHAIKSLIFTKMRKFLLNHLNFSEFSCLRRQK